MNYLLVILMGYLLGSSSMAFYIGKWNKVDIKKNGSKNYGASNAMMLMGWKAGILVGVHDIGKGILAVFLARVCFANLEYAAVVAGVACVLGHIFPFYLNFDGGKGFATYIGMMIGLDIKLAIGVVIVILVVSFITDYIVSGTLSTITIVPLYFGIFKQNQIMMMILLIASLVILYKHRGNIERMINGTEARIRSAHHGDYRVK